MTKNIETKIILENYKRQLEKIIDQIQFDLPEECSEEHVNILKMKYTTYPILDDIREFNNNIQNDIDSYGGEE